MAMMNCGVQWVSADRTGGGGKEPPTRNRLTPMIPTTSGQMMCQYRSWVASECLALAKATS